MGNEQRYNPHFLLHSNPQKTGKSQQIFNRAWMSMRMCFCSQCCREGHGELQRSNGGLCCLCEECGQGNIMSLLQSEMYGFYFVINYPKVAPCQTFYTKALTKSGVFKSSPIFDFSISGLPHWVSQVPGIPSLYNTTRLDNINYDDGVTNFLLI